MSPSPHRAALTYSVVDGLFYAVMVGVAESYLGAFAVELGHGPFNLALLSSVPLLAGALAQLGAVPLVRWLRGRKRVVVLGATIQALSHLGFIAIAVHQTESFAALLSVKALFWISGSAIAPAWSAWIADVTEHTRRERYFALRSAAIQAMLLVAFLTAGAYLAHAEAGSRLATFAALFGAGLLMRGLSALCLALQPDPRAAQVRAKRRLALRTAIKRSRWRFAGYWASLMLGAHLSVPFFTPYMLRELRLDYSSFAALSAVSILVKALYLPFCHVIAVRLGLARLLFTSGMLVATVPALWLLGRDVSSLLLAHVVGGIAWAGAEYAAFQLLLDSSDDEHRLEFMGLSGALTGAVQVAGSVVGALLLNAGLSYAVLFSMSSMARALPLALLWRADLPLRPRRLRHLFFRIVGTRPAGGAQQRPILTEEPPP